MASPENKRSSLERQRSGSSADRKSAAPAGPTILQFLRHADLSSNSMSPLIASQQLTTLFARMSRLTTLHLDKCELGGALLDGVLTLLPKLEHICLCDNGLSSLPNWETFSKLKQLHTLELRRNRVEKLDRITFEYLLKRLSVVDLSHNQIVELPDLADVREEEQSGSDEAYAVALLNVSNNQLTSLGGRIFVACSNLRVLDVSNNRLESIPPQLRRLQNLRMLDLSHNPLGGSQLKQVGELKQLERLNIRATGRTARNSLYAFDGLERLRELDASGNEFGASGGSLPSAIFFLSALKRLSFAECGLRELKLLDECPAFLASLEHLDVSRNELAALPTVIGKLSALRTLLADSNCLTLDGMPSVIFARLTALDTLSLADNQLELLPEAICRLPKLRRLVLSSNRLVQLPETITCLLDSLDSLELSDNPSLAAASVPPAVQPFLLPRSIQQLGAVRKPADAAEARANREQAARDARFYNIDFTLNTQLRIAAERQKDVAGREQLAALADADAAANRRSDSDEVQVGADPVARMRRLRKLRSELARTSVSGASGEKDADSVLKGMRAIVGERDKLPEETTAASTAPADAGRSKPRWDERLRAEQPTLSYSDLYDEDVGQSPGVRMWEIDQFMPAELEADAIGQLYEEDCYVLLHTSVTRSGSLSWQIYFWLGRGAALDKRACAAMHAVNLRNALQASSRITRVEQADEPDDFLAVFAEYQIEVAFFPGARTLSGFYAVQKPVHANRLYLLQITVATGDLWLECVPLGLASLDTKYVFLLDAFDRLYVWFGERSRPLLRTKARLFVEHLCKQERKGAECRVIMCAQSMEPGAFRRLLGDPDAPATDEAETTEKQKPMRVRDWLPDEWQPRRPLFYKVEMGTNAVDLRRVELLETGGLLRQSLLKTDAVYLLDCNNDLFVWIGRRSSQFLRVAAMKIATELYQFLYLEQARSDAPAPDACVSVRRHVDTLLITRVLEQGEPIVFRSKFAKWVDPLQPVDFTRTHESITRRGADLQAITAEKLKADLSVLFTKRVAPLSHAEADRFEADALADLDTVKSLVLDSSGRKFISLPEREFGVFYNESSYVFLCRFWVRPETAEADAEPTPESDDTELDYKCVVYFWSGRHASKLGWLQFTFTMQKKLEEAFGERLEVVRIAQQREDLRFLALFKRRFLVLNGSRYARAATADQPSVLQLRANNNPLTLRCIELEPPRALIALNSAFCFLAKLPRPNPTAPAPANGGSDNGVANEDAASCASSQSATSNLCYTIYLWQGQNTSTEDRTHAARVAHHLLRHVSTHVTAAVDADNATAVCSCACRVEMLLDGSTDCPAEFWRAFGWTQPQAPPIVRTSNFLSLSRLFRCSNESGYYCVTERCADFCQDDLNDDDVMLLDTGTAVFCWIGKRTDDTEIKLALRTAQLYVQYLKLAQPNAPRKIQVCKRGRELPEFTQCFHGWSKFREVKEWSG